MYCDGDRPHSRSTSTVGDAEGFMQVEVADVGAADGGAGEADLRVHVGAVHVDLAAVVVDDFADLLHALFEHAVRARVGDHQAGEVLRVLGGFALEVFDFDAAVGVAGDCDDLEAGDDGAGGIGAVGAGGDKAN